MHRNRPRVTILTWFGILATLWGLSGIASVAVAAQDEGTLREMHFQRPISRSLPGSAAFGTSNSDCPDASCDTVWVGYNPTGPGGSFLGVGVGGKWDFDTNVAGTDSTQGWRRQLLRFHFNASRPADMRPEWALDYGNQINEGNSNLWNARDLAGRKYVRTGVAGAWHSDDLVGVKLNVADAGEPSAVAIAGSRSAWCGLRPSGDNHAVDALTGNYINGDLITDLGGAFATGNVPEFPGFCNQWDQMLYKDFSSAGSGNVSFRTRVEMSDFVDTVINGSGWFNPDPTGIGNFVNNPADSFMVYVGSPNEAAYDTNRRWFSEVLDLSKPWQELFAVSGTVPVAGSDTSVTVAYGGIQPVSGKVRVVFRVKTNRVRSDAATSATGFNTKTGAALLDQVQVDGGTVYGFESAGSVTARSLIGDLSADGGAWATTGKPPSVYYHIDDVGSLLYEDLCGGVGAPTRVCNLAGNVLVAGDHDAPDHQIPIESFQAAVSPTIDLAVRNAAPGTKNAQGLDQETASRPSVLMDYDVYTGFMGLDESIFWLVGVQAYEPTIHQQPLSGAPIWSEWLLPGSLSFNPDPQCFGPASNVTSLTGFGLTGGTVDSLRLVVFTLTQGYRFGGTNLGNTRGTHFDNLRVGFARSEAPPISWDLWDRLNDQFPFNESVTPADNAAFDTTTALMKIGNNINPITASQGLVAGDTVTVQSAYTGDGVASGTRVDFVFRIDPGPGNYTVPGDRASALVNRDPAHPFFAAYLANNGLFGTPGGHAGGVWDRNVWNSARMDSSEINLYPILSRGISGVQAPIWMSSLHELDPKFNTLGITHNVCFLVDPNGPNNETNTDCSGTPPAIYGGVSGTTKEGTKIIPDGWFSPGTHIEYFIRESRIENPASQFTMLPDTNTVFVQDPAGFPDFDAHRWESVDVLPDMWKSTRYNGSGLACVLMVDANDRRGAERGFIGAADTLGYGKNNGATTGWKGLGQNSNPNDPAGFVAANLGQYGLNFDWFDEEGAEGSVAGHLGARFAINPGNYAGRGDKSGPSAAQLRTFYSSVFLVCGDAINPIHDGIEASEQSDDIAIMDGFLNAASGSDRKSIWINGDDVLNSAVSSTDPTLYDWITTNFGADIISANYKASSGSAASTVGFLPTASWAHPGRVYSYDHRCIIFSDVLSVVPTVSGAAEGAQYENIGALPDFTASVYRPLAPGTREYRTLFDGFDLNNLRGSYSSLAQIGNYPDTDVARFGWMDDVWGAFFQLCSRRGPVVAVGDAPGVDGQRFANRSLGAFPNPAFAGRNVTLRFTLAKSQDVTIRIYNVAGREVANFTRRGVEGPNNFVWDGALSNGARATAGVYFYRVDGLAMEKAAPQKMILLSSN